MPILAHVKKLSLIIKSILWLVVERGVQILVAIFIAGYIARAFGPELYGKWQYALSLLFLIGTLAYFCGAEVIVPKIVRKSDDVAYILGAAFIIRLSGSAVAFTIAHLYIKNFSQSEAVESFLGALLILLLLNEPFAVIIAWFQAQTLIAPVVKIRLAGLALKALVITSILHLNGSPIFVAVAWVGEGLFVALALLLVYHRLGAPKWRLNASKIKKFLKEGFAYWPGILFMCVFVRLDRLFIADVMTFDELGLYSAAIQIAENWFIFAGVLSQSISPKYIFSISSTAEINRNIKRLFLLYLAISIFGSILIGFAAPLIIDVVFGTSYRDAAGLLKCAVFVSVGVFIDSLLTQLMLKDEAAVWVTSKWLVALLSGFIVNSLLIKSMGSITPIIALGVGYGCASSIGLVYWFMRGRTVGTCKGSLQ